MFILVYSDAQADQFMDKVVAAFNHRQSFDTVTLPGKSTNVHHDIGLIHIDGQIVIHFIKITGLGYVTRMGEVQVEHDISSNSTIYKALLQLGGSNVKAYSSVSAYFGPYIHPEFRIESDIGSIGTHFSVQVDSKGVPTVKNFEIDQLQKVRFHLQGPFLPFDPMIEIFNNAFVTIFNNHARHFLSKQVQPLVEAELKSFKLKEL